MLQKCESYNSRSRAAGPVLPVSHMPLESIKLVPSANFWPAAARALLAACYKDSGDSSQRDFARWRVVLPTFAHAQPLKAAIAAELGGTFVPPQFFTLSGWLMTLPPLPNVLPASERLMRLYAELRQHGWLKKLFTARRNTDLLPLAQTLLALSDELTQALLPGLHADAASDPEQRWQHRRATRAARPGSTHLIALTGFVPAAVDRYCDAR